MDNEIYIYIYMPALMNTVAINRNSQPNLRRLKNLGEL